MDYFKAKVDAGADYIVTQLFFDNRDLVDFRERCALNDIHIPFSPVSCRSPPQRCKRIAELRAAHVFPLASARATGLPK